MVHSVPNFYCVEFNYSTDMVPGVANTMGFVLYGNSFFIGHLLGLAHDGFMVPINDLRLSVNKDKKSIALRARPVTARRH